ncbi:MAG: T9SS type A sorting domain-containing protein [Gemmatimonadetes bacterium]|nr:T9SS type A sorting domain-containing protein [Gemmatimonadota bacterium]
MSTRSANLLPALALAVWAVLVPSVAPLSATTFRHTTDNSFAGSTDRGIGVRGGAPALDGTSAWVTGHVITLVHEDPFLLVETSLFVGRLDLATGDVLTWNAIEAKANPDDALFDDRGVDIVPAMSGGALAVGETFTTAADGQGILLSRVSDSAVPVWTKALGTAGIEETAAVVETADEGFLVLARTDGLGGGTGFDLLLVKVSAGGAVEWSRGYAAPLEQRAGGLVATSDGAYVVAGSTGPLTDRKQVLLKVDATGTLLWSYAYPFTCDPRAIIEASNGDLVIAGTEFGSTETDAAVVRVTSSGTPLWRRPVGRDGLSNNEQAYDLYEVDGDFVVAGSANEVGLFAIAQPYVFRVDSTGVGVDYSVAASASTAEGSPLHVIFPVAGGEAFAAGYWNGTRAHAMRVSDTDLGCDSFLIEDSANNFVWTSLSAETFAPTVTAVALVDYPLLELERTTTLTDETICSGSTDAPVPGLAAGPVLLSSPSPNPLRDATTIHFSLERSSPISLDLYDVSGRRLRTIVDRETREAGSHAIRFDGSGLQSGVYFLRLTADRGEARRKLVVAR